MTIVDDNTKDIRRSKTISEFMEKKKSNCLHDACSKCHGTGRDQHGGICIHMIACPCPKCTPWC